MSVYLLYYSHPHYASERLLSVFSSVEQAQQGAWELENRGNDRKWKDNPVITWHTRDNVVRGYSPSYWEYRIETVTVDAIPEPK